MDICERAVAIGPGIGQGDQIALREKILGAAQDQLRLLNKVVGHKHEDATAALTALQVNNAIVKSLVGAVLSATYCTLGFFLYSEVPVMKTLNYSIQVPSMLYKQKRR